MEVVHEIDPTRFTQALYFRVELLLDEYIVDPVVDASWGSRDPSLGIITCTDAADENVEGEAIHFSPTLIKPEPIHRWASPRGGIIDASIVYLYITMISHEHKAFILSIGMVEATIADTVPRDNLFPRRPRGFGEMREIRCNDYTRFALANFEERLRGTTESFT